jgi:hypothetical protein
MRRRRRRAVARRPGVTGHRRPTSRPWRSSGSPPSPAHTAWVTASPPCGPTCTSPSRPADALVCAHYLHPPFDLDRATVLRSAAHALRPGGRLLVVDHGSAAPWSWSQDPDTRYPSPREVTAGIDLAPETWTVERADAPRRIATGPDGRTTEVTDHILLIRRTA